MYIRQLVIVFVLFGASAAHTGPAMPADANPLAIQDRVNADALVLQSFKERIDAYVDLHKKAAGEGPRLKESEEPAEIHQAQDALAARIRAARAGARPGDIFTPEIRVRFRQLLYPETKGEKGADAKAILKDDAPAAVPLKVNAKYPEGAPLPTVPVTMLMNLPVLPEQLEYRIVGRHLILRDTRADIIVDFMTNVIQ
jgi:hypothetical protein